MSHSETPESPPRHGHQQIHCAHQLHFVDTAPWPEPADGATLLDSVVHLLRLFVVLPKWAAETLALWVLHTYAFNLRDTSAYIGIESPEKRCGKTTLLTVLSELVHRPVVAANITSPAWFRVIQELQPTLLIDEADTFLKGNHALRGILNSGCKKKTAFVVRVSSHARKQHAAHPSVPDASAGESSATAPQPATQLATFSSWCPKALATIGRFPDTVADRCILIRMQRKTTQEKSERLRHLDAPDLRSQCLRFVADHAEQIANAKPQIPADLNDRAADIWEPLLALADLAGGQWPTLARDAAVGLTASAQDHSPIGTLMLDIFMLFVTNGFDRIFSRTLAAYLNTMPDRPWSELRKGKAVDERWLARIFRPYQIFPKTIWIDDDHARGYLEEDLTDVFRRYIPKSELLALKSEIINAPRKDAALTPAPAADATAATATTEPTPAPSTNPQAALAKALVDLRTAMNPLLARSKKDPSPSP